METIITKQELEELKSELDKHTSQIYRKGVITFYMDDRPIETRRYATILQRNEIINHWLKSSKGLLTSHRDFYYIISDVEVPLVKHKPAKKREPKTTTKSINTIKHIHKQTKLISIEPTTKFIRPKAEYSNQRLYDYT